MLITADRIIHDGYAYSGIGIDITSEGRIAAVGHLSDLGRPDHVLQGKVLLPGFVNAHSHAFHRLLRGRTQFVSPAGDNFWTWREAVYWVARELNPEDVYVATRQAFLEMLLGGITTVGEFHYLHHQPDGEPYDNPHELSDAVVEAARDVGIRLSLIRAIYLRGDFNAPKNALQKRFCDGSLDVACDRFDALVNRLIEIGDSRLSWAVAAHSVRTVPIETIVGLKVRLGHMPFHIHVAEQQREVDGCVDSYGETPVALLARYQVLDACTTLVHATHLRGDDARTIAKSGALVCACPSTEADLGDGLAPVSDLYGRGVPFCLGTGSQTLSSGLAEARRIEMHQRLQQEERNVLGNRDGDSVAKHVLRMATSVGATALGVETGKLTAGKWADFVSYDLDDPALAGTDDWTILPTLIFSCDSRPVRDVLVGGEWIVRDGEHPHTQRTRAAFDRLAGELFSTEGATGRNTEN